MQFNIAYTDYESTILMVSLSLHSFVCFIFRAFCMYIYCLYAFSLYLSPSISLPLSCTLFRFLLLFSLFLHSYFLSSVVFSPHTASHLYCGYIRRKCVVFVCCHRVKRKKNRAQYNKKEKVNRNDLLKRFWTWLRK